MVNYRRPVGLFAGKVIKWAAKKIPYDFTVAGVSLKNMGIAAALIAADNYIVPGRYRGYLEDAGWMIIIEEIAHALGINPGEEKVIYVEKGGSKGKALYV